MGVIVSAPLAYMGCPVLASNTSALADASRNLLTSRVRFDADAPAGNGSAAAAAVKATPIKPAKTKIRRAFIKRIPEMAAGFYTTAARVMPNPLTLQRL